MRRPSPGSVARAAEATRTLLRRYFDRYVRAGVARELGLTPITESQSDDVFICGYPKSGNTWFQHLVTALVFGLDVTTAPDSLLNDLVPDIHFKQYYRRYASPVFFKSHHLPAPHYRRIVYLLRDGRDAMVSYYHHLQATSSAVDFYELVTTARDLFPGKWHAHVEQYMRNPYGASMITIKYEDLKRDPAEQLRRFCSFAGLDRDAAQIARAIEQSSFQRMRQKEERQGWDTANWPQGHRFVRRGQVGSHRDEMPPKVLDAFLAEAGETLSRQGYL